MIGNHVHRPTNNEDFLSIRCTVRKAPVLSSIIDHRTYRSSRSVRTIVISSDRACCLKIRWTSVTWNFGKKFHRSIADVSGVSNDVSRSLLRITLLLKRSVATVTKVKIKISIVKGGGSTFGQF